MSTPADLPGTTGLWQRLGVVVILMALAATAWFLSRLAAGGQRDLVTALHTPAVQARFEREGYTYLHFDRLRGLQPGESPAGRSPFTGIPEEIRFHDGMPVALEGYAEPIDIHADGRAARLLLFRHLADCCFGEAPQRNEWVEVRIPENARKARLQTGDGIVVAGTFRVGNLTALDGATPVFYLLEADRVELVAPY